MNNRNGSKPAWTIDIGRRGQWGKRRVTVGARNKQPIVDEINPHSTLDRNGLLARAAGDWKLDATALAAFERELIECADRADAGPSITFGSLTGPAIADFREEVEYFVPGILARGHHGLIAGPNKSLKTSIALDLVLSLAHGRPFLDQWEVDQSATVGMMSGESGLASLTKKLRRIAGHKGFDIRDVGSRLVLTASVPHFQNAYHLLAVEEWILEHAIELLIIDPVYLCSAGSNQADVGEQGAMLRSIAEICDRQHCTLLLVHHLRKGSSYNHEAPELTDAAGAGFAEWAGQWLLLGRREKFDPNTATHRLWLVVGGRAEHWGQWGLDIHEGQFPNKVWEPTLMESDEIRDRERDEKREAREAKRQQEQADKIEAAREKIMRAFIGIDPPRETVSRLRSAAGYSGNSVPFSEAIGCLIREGKLRMCEVTKANGQTYEGVEIVDY